MAVTAPLSIADYQIVDSEIADVCAALKTVQAAECALVAAPDTARARGQRVSADLTPPSVELRSALATLAPRNLVKTMARIRGLAETAAEHCRDQLSNAELAELLTATHRHAQFLLETADSVSELLERVYLTPAEPTQRFIEEATRQNGVLPIDLTPHPTPSLGSRWRSYRTAAAADYAMARRLYRVMQRYQADSAEGLDLPQVTLGEPFGTLGPGGHFVLRRYDTRDLPAILELHRAERERLGVVQAGGFHENKLDDISRHILHNGDFLVAVDTNALDADQRPRVVAIGAVSPASPSETPATGEISRMTVRSSYQQRGLARTVLRALEQRATELGFTRLVLDTTDRQQPAIALYRKAHYLHIRTAPPAADQTASTLYFAKRLTSR